MGGALELDLKCSTLCTESPAPFLVLCGSYVPESMYLSSSPRAWVITDRVNSWTESDDCQVTAVVVLEWMCVVCMPAD